VDCRAFPLAEFVVGPENRLVAAAVEPLLQATASDYSPLVFCGPHGSGKSHLAQGLAAAWRQRLPKSTVACLTGAEFAQDFAAALAQSRLSHWRQELRAADLFVLDDVDHLAEKPAAQQELLHALDALADRGAAAVVTARAVPTQSTALLSALRSRLSEGLSVTLSLPGPAARRFILDRVAADGTLSKRLVRSLADGLTASVPSLVSAWMELEWQAREEGRTPGGKQVREFVAQREDARMPSLQEIAARTARYFGLKVSDLASPRRPQPLVAARGVAMYLSRQLTDKSYEQIGAFFGKRDHSTVMHGCRRTEKLLRRDRATRQAVAELRRWLST
jgi:chromosomal replication initiator protein